MKKWKVTHLDMDGANVDRYIDAEYMSLSAAGFVAFTDVQLDGHRFAHSDVKWAIRVGAVHSVEQMENPEE